MQPNIQLNAAKSTPELKSTNTMQVLYLCAFIFLNSLKIKITMRYTTSKRSSLQVSPKQLILYFAHFPFTCKESPEVQVYRDNM